ncbi:MAG: hypothetical protein Ta2G_04250 [Termitinemataceae bacterium]|nr:MAG: hypothetical protein Ta2G_04250 [Termitinemataceae bacterium]
MSIVNWCCILLNLTEMEYNIIKMKDKTAKLNEMIIAVIKTETEKNLISELT